MECSARFKHTTEANVYNTEETFLQDVFEILNRSLQDILTRLQRVNMHALEVILGNTSKDIQVKIKDRVSFVVLHYSSA